MRKLPKTFTAFLALILLLLPATACQSGEPPAASEPPAAASSPAAHTPSPSPAILTPPPGTLSVGVLDMNLSAHPHSGDNALTLGVLEGLLRLDGSAVLPGVAESCETEDYTLWHFTLRENAKWSDGTAVTAEDFLFAWKLAEESGAFDAIPELKGMEASAEAPNKISITLQAPCAWLPQYAASANLAPIHRAVYEKAPGAYGKTPESTGNNGAYMLAGISPDGAELVKNEHYWDAASVSVKNVQLRSYSSNDGLPAALQGGMIHAAKAEGVPADGKWIPFQGATTMTILMNQMRISANEEMVNEEISGILSSPHFRMALSYAIDRASLAESSADAYHAANYLVPGIMSANNNAVISGEHESKNLESARTVQARLSSMNLSSYENVANENLNRFLREMNYSGIENLPTFPLTAADDESSKAVAQSVAMQVFDMLGINLSPEFISHQELQKRAESGDYDLMLYPIKASYNDSTSILKLFGKNDAFHGAWAFMNPQMADLFDKSLEIALMTTDQEERIDYLLQAESIALLAAPILPLYYQSEFVMTDESFAGFRLTWDGRVDYTRALASR